VRLEDIAEKVGVSHSTVSRALSGSPLVKKETAERIRSVASEAGYQVNQIARNLKCQSTKIVGLIVPEVSNPFFPRLIQNIADQLRVEGYSLHLQLSGANQADESTSLGSLFSNRVDGVLLVTGEKGLIAHEMLDVFTKAGVPIVLMGWVDNVTAVDVVTGDDSAGGFALAQHLVSLGHQRIAIIGKPAHRGKFDRLHGFLAGMSEHRLTIDDELICYAQTNEEIHHCILKMIRSELPPTAIVAYQDSIALEVYRCLAELNISVPEQMTVTGFDDLDLASVISPPLTTVGGHIEPLTREYVKLLLSRIRKEDQSSPKMIVVTPRLIVRGSSSSPRSSTSFTGGNL
jgi:DNA-binding LacI/PurR family transcriptional regulator